MKKLLFSISIGVCFLLVAPAFSKEPSEIAPITVYGSSQSTVKDVTASSTRIQVSDYQDRITTIPEVLSEQAGVHITRYGGLEDFTSISIRGSSSEEVLILLDGIPLNTGEAGGVDLSPFFLESLDSIDVYRGAAPVQFGSQPSAGAVSLNSKRLESGQKMGASLGYGSFNTLIGNASYSLSKKQFGFLISSSVSRTDGDFTFLDDNGTPVNVTDDEQVSRQNNASQTIHPIIKFFYQFDDRTNLKWVNHFIRKDAGVPGFSTNQSESANLDTTAYLTSLNVKRDSFLNPKISLETLTSFRFTKNQYSDLNGEIGLGGAQDNDDDTTFFGQQFTLLAYPGDHHNITTFMLYHMERFTPENFLSNPSKGPASLRQMWNMGLGDEMAFFGEKLLLNPSVTLENVFNRTNNSDPSFLSPSADINNQTHHALSARLGIKGILHRLISLQANGGRGFRFPTFPELFGDRGGIVGNPELQPQESINWDAGLLFNYKRYEEKKNPKLTKASLNIFYFDRHVDDLIQFEQNSGFARAENVGKARINGVEVQGYAGFFNHLNLSANYTFQNPKDKANNAGRFLPGKPRHEMDAKVEGYIKRGSLFVSTHWMDEMFLDPLNTRVVTNSLILNSGFSIKATKQMTFAFEGKNLTNNQTVDIVGFPLPGRSFFGRVQFVM